MEEGKVSILVLIGLPGAGKSTLCCKLSQACNTNTSHENLCLIHVCFDDLIPLTLQTKFVQIKKSQAEDTIESDWKSARREVAAKVDQLIEGIKTNNVDDNISTYFNLTAFPSKASYVIVLDDNFYYRSMRYEYFQLARKHTIGFCQCYVECAKDVAEQRNKQRLSQVPSEVIQSMAEKIEPPLPQEYTWENHTVVISSQSPEELDLLMTMVYRSLASPVQPLEDRQAELAEARLQCSLSVVHQADLTLRLVVGSLIKDAKMGGIIPTNEIKEFSKKVNLERQHILTALREGALKLPAHIAQEIEDNDKEELSILLKEELKKNLQDKKILG